MARSAWPVLEAGEPLPIVGVCVVDESAFSEIEDDGDLDRYNSINKSGVNNRNKLNGINGSKLIM